MNKEMNYTHFLGRTEMEEAIKRLLSQFPLIDKCHKRNIYLRGNSGVGKTSFISRILAEMQYEVIHYDTGESKSNNSTIDLLTKNTVSCTNVISSFKREKKKHVVLIDDTDSLSISDKPALSTLIKLVRPKKTKKQQTEPFNTIPIIFVGNMQLDKNLKDLILVCNTFEMFPPTREQMSHIVKDVFPEITSNERDCEALVDYLGEDLSKLSLTYEYYRDTPCELLQDIQTIFIRKTKNTDRAQKIHQLYNTDIPLKYHSQFINETDRTTVSLLWHENVIDLLKHLPVGYAPQLFSLPLQEPPPVSSVTAISSGCVSPVLQNKTDPNTTTKKPKKGSSSASTTSKRKPSKSSLVAAAAGSPLLIGNTSPLTINAMGTLQITLPVYVRMLENICYSDFIDRTTFQKQVWKLNEISSIIKTFQNNHLLHMEFLSSSGTLRESWEPLLPKEIRFTKILTKYSSEYNNFWFIRNICQTLGIDKNDLLQLAGMYSQTTSSSNSVPTMESTLLPLSAEPKASHLLEWFEANEFDLTTLNRLIKYYKVCASGLLTNNTVEIPGGEVSFLPELDFEVII